MIAAFQFIVIYYRQTYFVVIIRQVSHAEFVDEIPSTEIIISANVYSMIVYITN